MPGGRFNRELDAREIGYWISDFVIGIEVFGLIYQSISLSQLRKKVEDSCHDYGKLDLHVRTVGPWSPPRSKAFCLRGSGA